MENVNKTLRDSDKLNTLKENEDHHNIHFSVNHLIHKICRF